MYNRSCSHCKSPLEEDVPESGVDTVSLIFRYFIVSIVYNNGVVNVNNVAG